MTPARQVDGLITLPSVHDAAETLRRLEEALSKKGVKVFGLVDHAAGARAAGLTLRPTRLLLFGDPRVGTALMQSAQTAGIDLPLKMLAWTDEAGQTWLSYNRPEYVVRRHGVGDRADTVWAMDGALEALARAATTP